MYVLFNGVRDLNSDEFINNLHKIEFYLKKLYTNTTKVYTYVCAYDCDGGTSKMYKKAESAINKLFDFYYSIQAALSHISKYHVLTSRYEYELTFGLKNLQHLLSTWRTFITTFRFYIGQSLESKVTMQHFFYLYKVRHEIAMSIINEFHYIF